MNVAKLEYQGYVTFLTLVLVANILDVLKVWAIPALASWVMFIGLIIIILRTWRTGQAKIYRTYMNLSLVIWAFAALVYAPFAFSPEFTVLDILNLRIIATLLVVPTWWWVYKRWFL